MSTLNPVYSHPRFPDYPMTVDLTAKGRTVEQMQYIARDVAVANMSSDPTLNHLVIHVDGDQWTADFIYEREYLSESIDRRLGRRSTTSI